MRLAKRRVYAGKQKKQSWGTNKMEGKCYLIGIERSGENGEKMPSAERIARGIEDIAESGERSFVCVMNRAGVYIADCLFALRKRFPDIKVDALIPYEEVAADWDEPLRDRYFDTVEKCENEAFFSLRGYNNCFRDIIGSIVDGAHRIVTILI